MLVKFIKTKKASTPIDAVLSYILKPTDASGRRRHIVKVVAGTMPDVMSLLATEVPSKTPYTHSVLAFSDSDMARTTEADRLRILDSYINELAAGLGTKNRMPYLAVSHGDHFHVVTLRYDLLTEKVYQPYVATRGDTARFNAWKDIMNARFGMSPPASSSASFRLDCKYASEALGKLVSELNVMAAQYQGGGVSNAAEMVGVLEPVIQQHGFEVTRVTRSGFSVMGANMRPARIRFTERLGGKVKKAGDGGLSALNQKLARYREKLMLHMRRYHDRSSIDGLSFQPHFMARQMRNAIPHLPAMA
ncbi:hypothetical protein FE236_00630 [Mariprofundus erugo]|uniref:hypothetical protein n=1 Tax=Mariprofundus erugo TaxID=2528639 RepID=UPI0010FF3B6D|nr:hypothetical protein [Mariprofundus erugo]TLS78299.1 hypothetical protein FE236_00630 [Mariprofundus erugo]